MRTPLSATVRWPSTIISRPHAEAPRSFQIVPMSDTRGAAAALVFSEVSAVELARQDRLPPVAWHSVELCDARIQLSVASAAVCGPDVDRLLASTFSFAPEVVHADMRRHLQMFAVCVHFLKRPNRRTTNTYLEKWLLSVLRSLPDPIGGRNNVQS